MELLLIMFVILAVVSIIGIIFLYVSKNPKVKNNLFYFLPICSLLITVINATGIPSNYVLEQIIAWSLGLLSIIAVIIKVKTPQKASLANLLVTISTLGGLIDLFFF